MFVQTMPLLQQLDHGMRALDLRYGVLNGKLRFWHGEPFLMFCSL
jgi:hypothetical protein